MPTAVFWLDAWAEAANLKPGEAVFRPVDRQQQIGTERLTDCSVARIVKSRVLAMAKLRGKSETEALEIADRFSGHSMRAGDATSAARADIPGYRIQQHTRHKSATTLQRYFRDAERWTKNGLKGVGF